MNLFEQFVIFLSRTKQTITVDYDTTHGYRTIKLKGFEFTEYGDSKILISSSNFYFSSENLEEVVRIYKSIRQ